MSGAFAFDTLSHPWVLALLAGVAVLLALELRARAAGTLSISTGTLLANLHAGRGTLLRHLPPFLRAAGLSALIFALAGPLDGYQVRKDRVDIIDIMLCVDVSGSMNQLDFVSNGQSRSRLFVTKEAVRDFIQSRKEKDGDRYGLDRVGLVLYAAVAWTQCPLTLDYGMLEHYLDRAEIAPQERDGTAIGSAIGLAVRRLSKSEAKSKVIILLTDGLNNRGNLSPLDAARIAQEYGMRVYTIGAGSTETPFGGFFRAPSQAMDEHILRDIAEATGAKYYRATDLDSLREAYEEINALETTEIDIGDYYEYKEAFPPYALAGLACLLASVFSRRFWFETIP